MPPCLTVNEPETFHHTIQPHDTEALAPAKENQNSRSLGDARRCSDITRFGSFQTVYDAAFADVWKTCPMPCK